MERATGRSVIDARRGCSTGIERSRKLGAGSTACALLAGVPRRESLCAAPADCLCRSLPADFGSGPRLATLPSAGPEWPGAFLRACAWRARLLVGCFLIDPAVFLVRVIESTFR